MDFSLTDVQRSQREDARRFADEVLAPGATQREHEHAFSREMVAAAAERGYLGLLVPDTYGGSGVGNLSQCLILEELARVCASTHVTISVHNSLVCGPTLKWGSDALKDRYVSRLARGELLGAYALSEPGSGSDAAALACTAEQDGDDWRLTGSKMWITTGVAADLTVVFARTDRDAPKAKGITAFLVDTKADGFSAGKLENKLGLRASQTVQLFLEDVRVPGDHVLGEVNRGFNYALETLNGGRVGIATQAVGIGQAIVDRVKVLLSERPAAKGSALGTQDQEFKLAEMATRIEAARLLTWRAAWLRDRGEDHIREASMAKLAASQAANWCAREAVAMLGALGWRGDAEVERLLRDARVTEIYEGTTEIQKLVIARSLA